MLPPVAITPGCSALANSVSAKRLAASAAPTIPAASASGWKVAE